MDEKIRVGDIEMCYRVYGAGPPVLMIMGLTATMDMWGEAFCEDLADTFKVIIFDNRGAGRTEAGEKRFTMKQFADDASSFLEGLGIDRASVVGGSMGGMIAQEFALRHPAKLDRLVLMCTMSGWLRMKKPKLQMLKRMSSRYENIEQQLRATSDMLFSDEYLAGNPEVMDEVVRLANLSPMDMKNARRQMGAIASFNCYGRLPEIKVRTLVLCGADDPLIPPGNSEMIARRIPRARLKIYPDSRHGFMSQLADECATEIKEFLSEQ